MMLLGGLTSKPTLCWSNATWIQGLNMGKLTKKTKEANTSLQPVRQNLMFHHVAVCKLN